MKVAVTDYTFGELQIESEILEPLGARIEPGQCRTQEELVDLTGDVDYVITQFAPVTAAVIAGMSRCRLISRHGVGVDNIDLDAAKQAGIPVCNVPDYCIDEVADHTLAMILALTRNTVSAAEVIRDGDWKLPVPLDCMKVLKEMTVGIVGFGRIGREVARRLHAFKCSLIVFDPVVPDDAVREAHAEPAAFNRVVSESDLLTLHCPSTRTTRGMLDGETISRMKEGDLLVNISRGDLIETNALMDALDQGRIAAAALDVTSPEPLPKEHRLRQMENVVISSHIAASSSRANRTLRVGTAQAVAKAIRGEPLQNVVNDVSSPRIGS